MRVFQHILWRADPATADSASIAALVREARAVQARLQAGEDFTALVRAVSQDTITRQQGGYLAAVTRGDLPPSRFATVAWDLQPGETSGLVDSPAGLHLLRRPPIAEAREQFRSWLAPRLARRADSLWVDSLARARGLQVADGAPARLRDGVREPVVVPGDAPLVTWEGGGLQPAVAAEWIAMLPPAERARLANAADSAAILFLTELGQRELVYGTIAPDGTIAPRAWEALAPQYREAVALVREEMRPALMSGDPSAGTATWVEAVTTGGQRYRPLPGGLAAVLRRGASVSVNHEAIAALVAAAVPTWLERRAADSLAALEAGTPPAVAPDSATP